jgi:hypothetical protein
MITPYQIASSLELSAAYFQSASSVFLSHRSANSTFSRLFSAQANEPMKGLDTLFGIQLLTCVGSTKNIGNINMKNPLEAKEKHCQLHGRSTA